MDAIAIAKEISFWLVEFIGICGLVISALWILDKTVTWITRSFQIYSDIVEFMWKKRYKCIPTHNGKKTE